MNKRGMTLMELLVYMAIIGIVVLVAGTAFSNSTKMRIRTESKLTASTLAENIGILMKEDISQTGAKSSKESSGDFSKSTDVYIDPANATDNLKDSSSFSLVLKSGCNSDCQLSKLTTKRIHHTASGAFGGVETVEWEYDGNTLTRHCETSNRPDGVSQNPNCPDDDSENNEPIIIAENVSEVKIIPAKPNVISSATVSSENLSHILPSTDVSIKDFRLVPRYGDENFNYTYTDPEDGSSQVRLYGFATNYDYEANSVDATAKKANQVFVAEANSLTGTWKDLCKQVTLEPQYEYEISFEVPYVGNESRMFCPGRDHAAVGFRDVDGNKLTSPGDFTFFPPAAPEDPSKRVFRFHVDQKYENVCMAFTFASYSPIASKGSLSIGNLVLKKIENSSFNFKDLSYAVNMKTADKKNIKAFKLLLSVKSNGETGTSSLVIPTPSNGPRD